MASLSNDFALDATRIAEEKRWLFDGSLFGSNLGKANLAGAIFWGANLAGVNLRAANLTGAIFRETNLTRADLRWTYLVETDLQEANLKGTRYNNETRWPDEFDPESRGAVNWDDLSKEERDEWLRS